MQSLVRRAETRPAARHECVVQASDLAARFPDVPGLATLRNRLTAGCSWRRLRSIQASAGLHAVRLSRWSPETPTRRVRNSLIGPRGPFDHLLIGNRDLVFTLQHAQPVEVELVMTASAWHA